MAKLARAFFGKPLHLSAKGGGAGRPGVNDENRKSRHGDRREQRLRAADCGDTGAEGLSGICDDARILGEERECGAGAARSCEERGAVDSLGRAGRDG